MGNDNRASVCQHTRRSRKPRKLPIAATELIMASLSEDCTSRDAQVQRTVVGDGDAAGVKIEACRDPRRAAQTP